MAAVSSSDEETDPPLTSTSKHAVTDTESLSNSPRFQDLVKTNRTAPLSPRGEPRITSVRVETARKVDEALAQWSGEDPSVSNPFPGIKLHKQESKEDMVQRALENWAGSDWQQKDAAVAVEVKKKHLSGSLVPKAFPGIELHDDTVENLAELPGAHRKPDMKVKVVPRGLSFPGIPIHDESEDLSELPGAKKIKSNKSLDSAADVIDQTSQQSLKTAVSLDSAPSSSTGPSSSSSKQSPKSTRSGSPKKHRSTSPKSNGHKTGDKPLRSTSPKQHSRDPSNPKARKNGSRSATKPSPPPT